MPGSLADLVGLVDGGGLLRTYGWRLLDGLRVTAMLVTVSCGLGFVLAYPICRARTSRNPVVAGAAALFTTLFRGTPLLAQLYLVYYGAGQIRPALEAVGLWGFFREATVCCLFTFTLNSAAYQAEILRGALASVPRGQREGAAALGLSAYRINRHVVWPQALLVALRPLGNELISVIKASALAAIVTLLDLTGQTRFIFARTFDFTVYLYAAILYLCITELVRRLWRRFEGAMSRHLHVPVSRSAAALPATLPEDGAVPGAPAVAKGVQAH